jgi:hypothetical protein
VSGAPAAAAPRRRRWFRRRGIDLADLAVNSFAAFLGVFIALMVQNWRDDHDKREKLDKARAAIHAEIVRNRDQVRTKLEYQRRIRDAGAAIVNGTLQPVADSSYNNSEAVSAAVRKSGFELPCGRIPGYTGFGIPSLPHAAFDAAQAAGVVSLMEIEETERIAAAYAAQLEYGKSFDRQAFLIQQLYQHRELLDCILIADEETYYSFALLAAYAGYLGEPPPQ